MFHVPAPAGNSRRMSPRLPLRHLHARQQSLALRGPARAASRGEARGLHGRLGARCLGISPVKWWVYEAKSYENMVYFKEKSIYNWMIYTQNGWFIKEDHGKSY